jgi:cell wall-associated NlpC family hydrolase
MPLKAGYLIAAGAGTVLVWSGLRGKSWSTVLRDVLTGNKPTASLTAYPITSVPGQAGGGTPLPAHKTTGPLGAQIAGNAQSLAGQYRYVFGGAPVNGVVDCSSFTNMAVAETGLAIPMYKAGAYHGQTHGPNTVIWLAWSGCFTIKRRDAAPGDLAIWQTHMGIIIDNGQHMISALNPHDGIQVTPIDGIIPREVLFIRRLKAVTPHGH